MTEEEIIAAFEECDDEYLRVECDERLVDVRADLHAMCLLDKLLRGPDFVSAISTRDIICGANHDIVYLAATVSTLAETTITREDIITLLRCGVHLEDEEYLSLFC